MTTNSQRLSLAVAAARAAGAVAMKHFQDPALTVDHKIDRSVVTAADREAERQMRVMIEEAFPKDGIVGEEHGVKKGTSGFVWHLDPIDGTQAYVRGVPLFGALVGVEENGVSSAGVIFMPALGEQVAAERGGGCWWTRGLRQDGASWSDGETSQARTSNVGVLSDAMFCTTWMRSFRESGRTDLFIGLSEALGVSRGWGDCYGYALVATGRAEVMIDPVLESWDAAPMPIILEEAGGRYTSFAGEPDIRARNGVATNGALHDEILRLIARHPPR